jgi:hypothetical protein
MSGDSGYRQAALTLHGLRAEDRRWLLAELPEAQRASLQALLGELDELGFEPGLVDDAANHLPALRRQSARQRVAAASVDQLAPLLAAEPAFLVAHLLRMERWPWRDSVLARLPAEQRVAVEVAVDRVREAPARDRCLLERLDQAIGHPVPRPVSASRKSTLIKKVASWIR